MKKLFLTAIFFTTLIQCVNAQEQQFGIIGGANYSTYVGDLSNFADIQRRLSFHLGISSEFYLSDNISFSPRIMYSSQGYNDEVDIRGGFENPTSNVKFAQRINFLNIPMLFNLYLTEKLGVQAGPQVGFLLNAVGVVKDNGGEESVEEGRGSSSNGNFKFDYGARLAAIYKITDFVRVEFGYYHGFSNINRSSIGSFTNNNSVFQLSVGYFIL